MMTTVEAHRTPFGDVSNKENMAPMKPKKQVPLQVAGIENEFQEVR